MRLNSLTLAEADSGMRWLAMLALLITLTGCGGDREGSTSSTAVPPEPPDFELLEPAVQAQFAALRGRLEAPGREAGPASTAALGQAWGALGQWFHVYRFPDSAIRCYREAIPLDPTEPRWPYFLGILQVERGQLEAAAEAFNTSIQRDPAANAARIRLAELHAKQRRIGAAEQLYLEALRRVPEETGARLGLARLALEQGLPERVIELLEVLGGDAAVTSDRHYLTGQALRMLGEAERARDHFNQLPDDYARRKPAGAQDPWLDALHSINLSSNHLTQLGHRAYGRGDFGRAALHAGTAARLNPDNPELRTNYAAALLALGRIDTASEQVEQALQQNPRLARAHMVRGNILERSGDTAGARDALRQAIRIDPELIEARRQLGRLHQRLGDFDAAIDQYALLRGRAEELREVRFWHAALLSALGRHRQALAALDEDRAQVPDGRALELLRVRILATTEDPEIRAPKQAAGLLEALPRDSIDVLRAETEAMVAAAQGDPARAVEWQLRAIDALETLPAGEHLKIARRRLTLYREDQVCTQPWERAESVIVKPIRTLPETTGT
jgi:tetratricopeptide (TPR) repeat protein